MGDVAYKLTILLSRRADLEHEDFVERWLEVERRDPVVAPGLARYVAHRPIAASSPIVGAPAAPYDAAIETWWRRKNDAADWVASREFEHVWLSERLPLLAGRPAAVGGEPQVVWEREPPAGTSPVTVLVLPVALRRLRFQDFVDHWTGAHAELALSGPHTTKRLVRIEDTPAPTAPPSWFERTRYDGVGALTFTSAAALAEEFADDHYARHVAPDERRFTDVGTSRALLLTEAHAY
ncbi:EthD domain-containing protein [Agromyces sp. NPDC049794]|uniref:EthD domain-containing protein n=1 Tax=unclassified Agromyces TaxID=2639701 RepID=UPI0033CD4634